MAKRTSTDVDDHEALAGAFVYVLFLKSHDHGYPRGLPQEADVVGVYTSKEAAAQNAGKVDTSYGNFDDAISSLFDDLHEDNRAIPSDDGILLQLGDESAGEGDTEKLYIKNIK